MSATTRTVLVEPGTVYRWWWIWSEPARLIIRLVVERWLRRSNWMLLFSTARLVAHAVVGNPWWSALAALVMFAGVPALGGVVAGVLIEVALLVAGRRRGRPVGLSLWRSAWKFHRQWPRVWADVAAKTQRIQGTDGGARGESRAAAIRPVVDHPRMPWRFWISWPVVTFRVGVAPGRTFEQFEKVVSAMGANMAWVHSVEVEYDSDRASFGLLHVALGDVLAEPAEPTWIRGRGRGGLRAVDGEAS